MTRDYYEVLGLKAGASQQEIRAAYKRLARKHHPDANPGSASAEEAFKQVSEAYQVLGDPEKRRRYDAHRAAEARGFAGSPFGGGGRGGPGGGVEFSFSGFDPGDLGGIFADLLGRRGGRGAHASRGADLEFEASVEFEQAIRGTVLQVPLARHAQCPVCGGAGRTRGGRGAEVACSRCGGEGVVRQSETVTVRIPAGAADGARVRVPAAGEAGRRGGPAGDLYILLRVAPHRHFKREGDDLILDLPLSFAEAALGARVEVPTLEGRATVTIPPGTRSGQRFRLRGKGVAGRGARDRGDLLVVAAIVPPRKATGRIKEILNELDSIDSGDPRSGLGW